MDPVPASEQPLDMTTLSSPAGATTSVDRRDVLARRRARRSTALVLALWLSGFVAAALYPLSGGMAEVSGWGGIVSAFGILAGLVGTDFVLVMLVLAARVPLLDRTIGHDRAIAVHRQLGKPALYLILAHAVLLVVGYAMEIDVDVWSETVQLWNTPDMPLAFIATGLFIAVVVTSLVAVRRRFSYEGWHLVHLLSYVAVGTAVPHQLTVGGVLAQGTAQRVYWIALYVVAIGSIVTYRVLEPIISTIRHQVSVAGVEHVAPGVVSVHLRGRDLRALDSAGGQFFVWRFWTRRTWWHAHPISLSSMPTDSSARITVRDLGAGSRALASVPVGTRVSLEGPYGLFTDGARTSRRLAVMAAGVGITPVRALLEHAEFAPGEARVLVRASSADESYLWREVAQIVADKGGRLFAMTGSRSRTGHGWMPQADADRGVTLTSVFPELLDSDLYICGPSAWLDLVVDEALAAGLPPEQIHAERFDW